MNPGEIRHLALYDRKILCEHLDRIDLLLEDREGMVDCEALKGACLGLIPLLKAHHHFDQAVLIPALKEADTWGDVRSELVQSHDLDQQGWIHHLESRLNQPDVLPTTLMGLATRLSAQLRESIADERRVALSPDVLRDDIIAIRPTDG